MPTAHTPLVESTCAQILRSSKQASAGDPLPSEESLCELASVSRTSVRRALEYLESQQYIERQGRSRIWRKAPASYEQPMATQEAPSRAEVARRHIIGLIAAGKINPGQTLNELSIARTLEMSTVPVREAMRSIENTGLLKRRARRSWCTVSLSEKQIKDIMDIRRLIEGYCIQSISRLEPRALSVFRTHKKQTLAELKKKPFVTSRALQVDRRFHESILAAPGNSYLYKRNEFIYVLIEYQFNHTSMPVNILIDGLKQHLEIIDCMLNEQWRTAHKAMMQHLDNAERILMEFHHQTQTTSD